MKSLIAGTVLLIVLGLWLVVIEGEIEERRHVEEGVLVILNQQQQQIRLLQQQLRSMQHTDLEEFYDEIRLQHRQRTRT
jgi:CHASE1-domain containing sensor protein